MANVTKITKNYSSPLYNYHVAKYDENGEFIACANFMFHSDAAKFAFGEFGNDGSVVDLTVR